PEEVDFDPPPPPACHRKPNLAKYFCDCSRPEGLFRPSPPDLLGTGVAVTPCCERTERAGQAAIRAMSRCRRPGSSGERQFMQQEERGRGDPMGPRDWLRILPSEAVASSARRGWAGIVAARYRAARPAEFIPPALTHHRLVLFIRPPEELDLRYDGVKRHVPPPAGAVSLVPAGIPSPRRVRGSSGFLLIYHEPP